MAGEQARAFLCSNARVKHARANTHTHIHTHARAQHDVRCEHVSSKNRQNMKKRQTTTIDEQRNKQTNNAPLCFNATGNTSNETCRFETPKRTPIIASNSCVVVDGKIANDSLAPIKSTLTTVAAMKKKTKDKKQQSLYTINEFGKI